ncbi:unnamed protein product [Lactuca saligna]|uniref:Uncharacterized protein n=1 Tax=Lactuca saligna TaxID=75948 RepID=A0AA36E9I9_LACSI|nr:unnamed protein product [Lactuca saligna]
MRGRKAILNFPLEIEKNQREQDDAADAVVNRNSRRKRSRHSVESDHQCRHSASFRLSPPPNNFSPLPSFAYVSLFTNIYCYPSPTHLYHFYTLLRPISKTLHISTHSSSLLHYYHHLIHISITRWKPKDICIAASTLKPMWTTQRFGRSFEAMT